MKKASLVFAALAAAWSSFAHAETYEGRITSVDPQSNTFQMTASNKDTREIEVLRVDVKEGARFDGAQSVADLAVGDQVRIDAGAAQGGSVTAQAVNASERAAMGPAAAAAPEAHAPVPSGATGGAARAETLAAQRGDPSLE